MIYHEVVWKDDDLRLRIHDGLTRSGYHGALSRDLGILSPRASSLKYAYEIYEIFFSSKFFEVKLETLQILLGEEGINQVLYGDKYSIQVIPKSGFNIKPWLRDISMDVSMEREMEKLSARAGTLLECPGLKYVEIRLLGGGYYVVQRRIGTIWNAFEVLAERLDDCLIFRLTIEIEYESWAQMEHGSCYSKDIYFEGLDKLEEAVHDKWKYPNPYYGYA